MRTIQGIRCLAPHPGHSRILFAGMLLEHLAQWHPQTYRRVLRLNQHNRKLKYDE